MVGRRSRKEKAQEEKKKESSKQLPLGLDRAIWNLVEEASDSGSCYWCLLSPPSGLDLLAGMIVLSRRDEIQTSIVHWMTCGCVGCKRG